MNSPFMSPRHRRSFLLRDVLFVSVFVLFAFVARNTLQGQTCTPTCPTNWLCGNTTISIPNPCGGPPANLSIKVEYCYPDPSGPVFPKTQITIQSINPLSPCALVNFTINDMRLMQERVLEAAGPGIIPCSSLPDCSGCTDPGCTCPGGYAQWNVVTGACLNDTAMGTHFFECGTGRCISLFEMCCRNGTPDARPLAMQPDNDSCTGPNCFIKCDNWNSGIVPCGNKKREEENPSGSSVYDPSLSGVQDGMSNEGLPSKKNEETP